MSVPNAAAPKRALVLIAAVGATLASLLMVACGDGHPARNDGVLVAASISHLADFARQVGGEHVQVVNLVPPGASPHTYELTPSQVEQVSRTRLIVLNGVGLESSLTYELRAMFCALKGATR